MRLAWRERWVRRRDGVDALKVFDGGFTSIIDMVFGPDGRLHVAELDELSWAAVEFFGGGVGGTVNACDLETLTCDVIASGIPMLTAMTFDRDGDLHVTENSLIPGLASVVEIPWGYGSDERGSAPRRLAGPDRVLSCRAECRSRPSRS